MLRYALRHKKGNTTLFHVLTGTIVGFLFLIFFLKILIPLLFNAKDYDGSFNDFVSQVEEISDPSTEIAERVSPIVLLNKNSAIIVFTPKQAVPNGRLGDGNLHVIQNKIVFTKAYSEGVMAVSGDQMSWAFASDSLTPKQYHFIRPTNSCSINKTCFCLCNKIFEEELDAQIDVASLKIIDRSTNTNKYNPYLYGYSQETKDNFLYDAPEKSNNIILNCKSISCRETDANLFMPLKSYYFSSETKGKEAIMFENGFILSREGYYATQLPERSTIHIIKLLNKEILIATQLSAILDVDTIVKVSRSFEESSRSSQVSKTLDASGLKKLYTEEALGHFIRKTPFTDQTTQEEKDAVKNLYASLDDETKERYTLDQKTGNLYQDATPYDFLPTAMKEYYIMGVDKSFILTNKRIDISTLQKLFREMPTDITQNYYFDDNGDIIFSPN